MTMADRIVVMDQGRIAQLGSPEDVYHRPSTPFVAAFMGADNTIDLDIGQGASGLEVKAGPHHAGTKVTEQVSAGSLTAYFRDDLTRLVDPEYRADNEIVLRGTIALRSYPGGHYRYTIAVGDQEFTVKDSHSRNIGTKAGLAIPIGALHLFPRNAAPARPN
jgi:ABC-type Fe3+/spermidine/putrescine transport system ATPase subunit